MLRDAREHLRADLIVVVECEGIVFEPGAFQRFVRRVCPLDFPADAEERSEYPAGLSG